MIEKLTIQDLYRFYLEEKSKKGLQPLPLEFYKLAAELMKELKEKLEEAKKVGDEELIIKYDDAYVTARKYLKDLLYLRLKKMLNLLLVVMDISDELDIEFLPAEKKIFKELVAAVNEYREIVQSVLKGEYNEEITKYKAVVLKIDLPSFVWEDEKVYGPFSKGDIAILEEELAKYLVDTNKAEFL